MENNSLHKNKQAAQQENAGIENSAEMNWFNSFETNPGIFDLYSANELLKLKDEMFTDLKNRLNKFD